MSERREAIFVNKLVKVHPLSFECQIYKIIDGLFECNICKRNICVNHRKNIKNESYCLFCLNDEELFPYINALCANENKKNCYMNIQENLKYLFSFEWIHKK